MNLVDVHCHIDKCDDGVVRRAERAGLSSMISNGTRPENNRTVLALAERHDTVEAALGIYPNDSLELSEAQIQDELDFIKEEQPIAIGECGLDYKYDVDKSKMRHSFRQQVELAEDLARPVIIHSRRAESDVLDILEEVGHDTAVLHCFQGSKQQVRRAVDAGHYFSIPSLVVRSEHFQMVTEMVAEERLLTETDSPYLAPERGEANEPATVRDGIKAIADVLEKEPETVASQVHATFQDVFGT